MAHSAKKWIKGAQVDTLALQAMKDVVSCDKLREAANKRWSGGFRMRQLTYRHGYVLHDEYNSRVRVHAVKWNISVTAGEEIKRDSRSSGERNGTSLNHPYASDQALYGMGLYGSRLLSDWGSASKKIIRKLKPAGKPHRSGW
jgi:hypothetical protein